MNVRWTGGRDRTLRLKVRSGNRRDGGIAQCYIAGNRQGLKALHYAIGQVLLSRTIEIFEGPGYTVIFDRRGGKGTRR